MTASLVLDSLSGRVLIVILVVVTALVLHRQGQDLATALILAAAVLGAAADTARRAVPAGEAR
ncbi:hypothetical protein [Nocardiopsis algeriensis]|uniref:Small-conductance mechanosensitive channel n=1 Tax=Nocardiopsis algeriensis TaxID=1478215 RepID=A0A841ISU5_9ACTN|nr:hypothetical protein [Nocardiopsis algeriensis]MBB6121743.1 small-conductance mechanosensitive channel [Nocardiopsis algeriensis]